jgi:hypothetical protein
MTVVCPGQAFATFYALEWVSTVPELWDGPCGQRRWDKFIEEKEEFEERFARLLFDYLAISCIGEARHAGDSKVKVVYKNTGELKVNTELFFNSVGQRIRVEFPSARNKSFKLLPVFPAKTWLETCQKIFMLKFWGSSYGGIKWANIARAALRYYTLPPRLFIDHIADIQHNGGTAFNKSYDGLIQCPDCSELRKLLNAKAAESGIKSYIIKNVHYTYQYKPFGRFQNYILSAMKQTNSIAENKYFFGEKYKATNVFAPMPDWPEPLVWGDEYSEREVKVVSYSSSYTEEQFKQKISGLYSKKYVESDDDDDECDDDSDSHSPSSSYQYYNRSIFPAGMIPPTTSIKGLDHISELALITDLSIMLRVGTEGLV